MALIQRGLRDPQTAVGMRGIHTVIEPQMHGKPSLQHLEKRANFVIHHQVLEVPLDALKLLTDFPERFSRFPWSLRSVKTFSKRSLAFPSDQNSRGMRKRLLTPLYSVFSATPKPPEACAGSLDEGRDRGGVPLAPSP